MHVEGVCGSLAVRELAQRGHRHAVGLDVVRVLVAAGRVVRDDDIRAQRPHVVRDERAGRLDVGRGERAGVLGRRHTRHAAVPEPGQPARALVGAEDRVVHTEPAHRLADLAEPERAERVAVRPLEVGQLWRDDLTLLPQRAGEDVHLVAEGDVVRHGDAAGQGLVVRVGMDEQQPAHRAGRYRARSWGASDDVALLREVAGHPVARRLLHRQRDLVGALLLRLGAPGPEHAAARRVLR